MFTFVLNPFRCHVAHASCEKEEIRRERIRDSLAKYRKGEVAMRERWDRDEIENFRKLPARAWPEYQPEVEEVPNITENLKSKGCVDEDNTINICSERCSEHAFNLATALLFNNLDSEKGLDLFVKLAKSEFVDGMVASGIVLVEGLGVEPNEEEGFEWLKKACDKGSAQGCFELATVFYNGIEGVVEEDEEKSFELFHKAAKKGHLGGMFMAADCMLEGIGTKEDVKQAIPLLANAAEQGHRYARQRMRELLDQSR